MLLLVRTSSVFLIVFGLWKSVHTFTNEEKQPQQLLFKDENVKKFQNTKSNKQISNKLMNERVKFNYPIVINTWPFVNATAKAWEVLKDTDDRLDASMKYN